ncbi:MAG: hypothetical protein ABSG87_00725 [Verrucomicrobiota bacterium]|jgi:hypothetical protein
MSWHKFIADAIGLIVLAGLIALCAAIIPSSEVTPLCFFFAYLALAVVGLFVWHNGNFPERPWAWLLLVFFAALIGIINWGIDILIGATQSADGILTIIIFPAMIFVALAGAARSFYINRRRGQT